jgi:twinkle protein
MSDIIGDTSCPKCVEAGKDSSGNHLMLFEDGGAYCNRCGYSENSGTFTESNVQFHARTPEEMAIDMAKVPEYTCFKHWDARKLSERALKHFGIRTTVSEADGDTRTGTYYPVYKKEGSRDKLTGYKVEYPTPKGEKKRYGKVGDCRGDTMLMGQNVCPKGGNKLFICEGEKDMVALYEILYKFSKPEWRNSICVVSVKNGSGGAHGELMRQQPFLDGFKEWVLCFDNDDAGEKAVHEVGKYLNKEKLFQLKIPQKDCNQALMDGEEKNTYFAAIKAQKPKPACVVTVDDVWERALVKPEMGLSFPWQGLSDLTYGIRRGVTYCVGAAPKIGKTDFEYQLICHLIKEHGQKVNHYDMENHPAKTVKRLAGKLMGQMFHKPGVEFKQEDLETGMAMLRGKWEAYKHDGSREWKDVKETIKQQAANGDWIFILDPLTAFVSQYSSSEANDVLNAMLTDIAEMNISLDITFFLFSHLNPPKTGKAHDDGGRVLSSQFTGSRAMEKWTHYGLGIERNRNAEEPDERNTSTHRLLYDREFGEGGCYDCEFDTKTGLYLQKSYGEVAF